MRRLSLIATATFCIVIIVSFCLCSCTKWHWTDPIGLSQKVITVGAAGGEVIVDATGTFSLSELYIFDSEENTHPASDNWGRIPKDPEDPYSEICLKGEWVEVHITQGVNFGCKAIITVSPNEGESRKCLIYVMHGDYSDCITLTQLSSTRH